MRIWKLDTESHENNNFLKGIFMVLVLLKFMLIYTHMYYIWFDMFNMMYTFKKKITYTSRWKSLHFRFRRLKFTDEVFDESRASFAAFLWLSQFSGQMFWMEHHHLWQGVPTLMVPNVLTIFWKKALRNHHLWQGVFFFSKKHHVGDSLVCFLVGWNVD